MPARSSGCAPSDGFTAAELVIVIGIIALLLAITFPAVHKVREQGRAVVCQSNERQLWQGVLAFATDNDRRVVGNQADSADPNPAHRDFLRGGTNDWTKAPQAGTLFPYVNRNTQVYRCPSRTAVTIRSGTITDAMSNGQFDYTIFQTFSGAKLEHLPATCTFTFNGNQQIIPTPYLCEEGPFPAMDLNSEGGHSQFDTLSHIHFGGSYYMAPDGSCNFFIEPMPQSPKDLMTLDYTAVAPSGTTRNFQGAATMWGWWDRH